MTHHQMATFVAKLNREDRQSLDSQWELAVLDALNHTGKVRYEPNVAGKTPDILCADDNFVAEIRTVSDDGLEAENSREFYKAELAKRIKAKGLQSAAFSDYPEARFEGKKYTDRKIYLKYPPRQDADKLFGPQFESFINYIIQNQPDRYEARVTGDGYDVTFYYHPRELWKGGGNLSYTTFYSITKNPIYNALHSKAQALRKLQFDGAKGIILTDGKCDALRSKMRGVGTYSDEQIILSFLRGTKTVAFVLTLYAHREWRVMSLPEPIQIKGKLFVNPKLQIPDNIMRRLSSIADFMPKPKQDSLNASLQLRDGRSGPHQGWYLGTKASSSPLKQSMTISARALLELMAGRLSQERFDDMTHIRGDKQNYFDALMKGGWCIKNIIWEAQGELDDDYVTITFEPDFAAKPYEIPKRSISHRLKETIRRYLIIRI